MSSENNLLTLCKYRFEQADETLSEARLLQEAGHYRGALNRAYYAMFYALQVLAIKNKKSFSKHIGIISFFDREYVKTGIIDKKFSKWITATCSPPRKRYAFRRLTRLMNLFSKSGPISKACPPE